MSLCETCKHTAKGHPQWAEHFRSCEHPSVTGGKDGIISFGIDITDAPIENGWFTFPFNFDPNWMTTCKGHEEMV